MVGNALFVGNCLPIDTERELLGVDGIDEDTLWPADPTDQEYEAYTGNAGPSLESVSINIYIYTYTTSSAHASAL
jgi:hypothetical protein